MWRTSRNLTEPTEKCNDFKYSKRRVEQLAKSSDGGLSEFKKIYADYDIVSCEPIYYEQTGWHIYLKMWKKKPEQRGKPKGGKQNVDEKKQRGKICSSAPPPED